MSNKAIFLDRDGTINREVDVLRDIGQFELLPGAADAIRTMHELGYLTIVVTNQPVIARGWMTHEGLKEIHDLMEKQLAEKGAKLDAIYYCPHHPEASLPEYRIVCECRKPGSKMIIDATKKFTIDPKQSFLIGDHNRDIAAGKVAGLTTILVETGVTVANEEIETKPDYRAKDLGEATEIIKNHAAAH